VLPGASTIVEKREMATITIAVRGMSCGGCVGGVTRSLQALAGVSQVDVSLESASAKVEYDPAVTDEAAVRAAVVSAGFETDQ
jgi:copper chaperone CopZ